MKSRTDPQLHVRTFACRVNVVNVAQQRDSQTVKGVGGLLSVLMRQPSILLPRLFVELKHGFTSQEQKKQDISKRRNMFLNVAAFTVFCLASCRRSHAEFWTLMTRNYSLFFFESTSFMMIFLFLCFHLQTWREKEGRESGLWRSWRSANQSSRCLHLFNSVATLP